MKIAVIGLSLSSSWGNGHATTYRALLKSMAQRGHDIIFLERDVTWYAAHRDLIKPPYCRLAFYKDKRGLRRFARDIETADVVIIGSFVADGIEIIDWALPLARGITAFYDIDTPVTIAAVRDGTCLYLAARQISQFDLYLSFTSGPLLRAIEQTFAAGAARALFCSVDTDCFRPLSLAKQWDLSYLGTYSANRQPALERLLIEPARQFPERSFAVAGAQYPANTNWPPNIQRIEHVDPDAIPAFFARSQWTLNLTRAEMIGAGFSPSVRLFEAAACAVPIISDRWRGLETIFSPGDDIVLADTSHDVVAALCLAEQKRSAIAQAARSKILSAHSAAHRAFELESLIAEIGADRIHPPKALSIAGGGTKARQ